LGKTLGKFSTSLNPTGERVSPELGSPTRSLFPQAQKTGYWADGRRKAA